MTECEIAFCQTEGNFLRCWFIVRQLTFSWKTTAVSSPGMMLCSSRHAAAFRENSLLVIT